MTFSVSYGYGVMGFWCTGEWEMSVKRPVGIFQVDQLWGPGAWMFNLQVA
jgi:hypothetical protein